MRRVPEILWSLERSSYPGYKGGGNTKPVENLATYGRDVILFDTGVLRDRGLGFDIERTYSWDDEFKIIGYGYSMMINGHYPKPERRWWDRREKPYRPTTEEFLESLASYRGFELEQARAGFLAFRGPSPTRLLVDYIDHPDSITIGVLQDWVSPDLDFVTKQVVPYAVALFNRLSPTWQIQQELIQIVAEIAQRSSNVVPRCRISGIT